MNNHHISHAGPCSHRLFALLFILTVAAACCPSAHAQLTITPTYDSTLTSLPNAAAVEAGIQAAITQITGAVTTRFPDAVTIDFKNMTSGLGSSLTPQDYLSYSTYLSDLQANPNKSALQISALATMPTGPIAALNNNTQMYLTASNLAAIGQASAAAALIAGNGGFNSVISFNFSLLNASRTGQTVGNYDLQATAMHEIDEVLGIGGNATELNGNGSTSTPPAPPTDLGPLDFFRYASNGTRSFTYTSTAAAYFSINGGATNLVNFNQTGNGDYGDWGPGIAGQQTGNTPPQVQDAFGTPYSVGGPAAPNLGSNEITALQVEGYNVVPEPGSQALLATAATTLLGFRRRRFAV